MKTRNLIIPILIILLGGCEKDVLNKKVLRSVEVLNLSNGNENIVPPFYLKYRSEDADFFNIYLDTSIHINNLLYSNMIEDSVLLDSLEYNKSYYVKVGAVYEDGDTIYSEQLQFKTATNFGDNIFPKNQQENVPINTVLKYFHSLANSYNVYILEPIEQLFENRTESELGLDDLRYNQPYIWKVQAICDDDKIIESEIFSFITTDGFESDRYPNNGSDGHDINVKLTFLHPLADFYRVYWGENPDNLVDYRTIRNESWLTITDLEFNTQYYWQVLAVSNNLEYSSKIFSFTTIEGFSDEIFPIDNSERQESNLKLSFYHPLAKGYTIYLDTNEEPKTQISINQIENWKLVENLENNTKYYWRVIANCDSNKTATSKIYSFKTRGNCKFEGFSKMIFDMPKYILKAIETERGDDNDTILVTSGIPNAHNADNYNSFCQDDITAFENNDELQGTFSGWFNVDTITETLDVSFENIFSEQNEYGDLRYSIKDRIQFSGLKYNDDEKTITVHLPNSEIINYIDTVEYMSTSIYLDPYDGLFITRKTSFELIEILGDKDLEIAITYK